MARNDEDMGTPDDRLLWRRCRALDAPDDEAARVLDLAALADGLLDEDEEDRVAALVESDPAATADVAAARAAAGGTAAAAEELERVIRRALALVPAAGREGGQVVAFAAPMRRRALPGVARWASLAAAAVMASWLGFAMGSNIGLAFSEPSQPSGDAFFGDFSDPGIGILRDFGEGTRT